MLGRGATNRQRPTSRPRCAVAHPGTAGKERRGVAGSVELRPSSTTRRAFSSLEVDDRGGVVLDHHRRMPTRRTHARRSSSAQRGGALAGSSGPGGRRRSNGPVTGWSLTPPAAMPWTRSAARHRPGRRGPLRQRRLRLHRRTGTPAGAATGATSASSSSPPRRDTTSRCGLTPACPGLVLMIGASGVVATRHDRDAPRRGARSCLGRGRAQTPRACPGKAGGPGRQWLAALGDGSRSAKCGV